jgi:hypothetical protein
MDELGHRELRMHVHEHGTEPHRRQREQDLLDPFAQMHAQPIAGANALSVEPSCQRLGLVDELGVAQ